VCGIAGIAHCSKQPVDARSLEAMPQSLAHRRPDGEGYELPHPSYRKSTSEIALVN
jgi:asparagine synthetase B (glutamine-hydrolysing)